MSFNKIFSFKTVFLFLLISAAAFFVVYQRFQPVEILACQIKQQPLQQWVVASGQVGYQSLAKLGVEVTGQVEKRLVKEGDLVNKGDLLLQLKQDEWQAQYQQALTALNQLEKQLYPQALASLEEAQLAFNQARNEAQRRQQLAQQGVLSKEQAEQAQNLLETRQAALNKAQLAAQALAPKGSEEQLLQQKLANALANLNKTQLTAPFAGRIQNRYVEPGDQVQPGKTLLEIAHLDGLEVIAQIDEKYLAPLQLGQEGVVIADAWPAEELAARLVFLAPAVDASSGTLAAHLEVTDSKQLLRQGMTVSVNLLTASKNQALVVNKDYLQTSNQGWQVMGFNLASNQLENYSVKLGLQTPTQAEIVSGINEQIWLVNPSDLEQLETNIKNLDKRKLKLQAGVGFCD